MTWHRHTGDSVFHTGAPGGGSFVTLCNGRLPLTDVAAGEVESTDRPPHDEKCEACERVRIEQLFIERGRRFVESGLAELAANAPHDLDNPFGFDFGGEG